MVPSEAMVYLEEWQKLIQKRPRKYVHITELTPDVQDARRRGVKGSRWAKESRELQKVKRTLGIIE